MAEVPFSLRTPLARAGSRATNVAKATRKAVPPPKNFERYTSDKIGNKANSEKSRLETNFGREENFYLEGGYRDSKNFCEFSYPGFDSKKLTSIQQSRFTKNPVSIRLPLSPSGVNWNYQMRYRTFDTLGGQVVQLLGVDITELTISGTFGFEGHWGKEVKRGKLQSGYPGHEREWPRWDKDPNFKNGLMQLSHWFREYFDMSTQRGNWDTDMMIFSYPQRGWSWRIRPKDFPRIRFSHDELAPQWIVTADFVEELQGNFTTDIKGQAKVDLGDLKKGVGFIEFVQWSSPKAEQVGDADLKAQAAALGERYSDYVGQFSSGEISRLLENNMTFLVQPYSESRIREQVNARNEEQEDNDT